MNIDCCRVVKRFDPSPPKCYKTAIWLALAPSLTSASPAVSRGNSDRRAASLPQVDDPTSPGFSGNLSGRRSGPLAGGMRQNPMRGLRGIARGRRSVAVSGPLLELSEFRSLRKFRKDDGG